MASRTTGLPSELGHFHVDEQIGAGGMGEVYRAHDLHLNREVALKVLPAGTFADATARKRFRREAMALSRLNHPNVETVFDFDTQDETDFLVLEYVSGVSLDARVAGGPISEDQVLKLGIQLCDGLAAAHDQGIIHRDLKPANLRMTAEGRLKILDFGLASLRYPAGPSAATISVSEELAFSGTLPYMAPEQACGRACDERTDIHAVGAVLYELATGKRAFPQMQTALLLDAILHHKPLAVRELNSALSQGFAAIVEKALDKEPGRRYQSAHELRVDLERLLSGVAPPRRRWHAVPAMVTATIALIGMVTAVVLITRKQALSIVPGDYVLIGDFDNQTGDPVFDKSLASALAISVEQTRAANVFGRTRIVEALRRMRRPPSSAIDESLAAEIATREAIKLEVLPSITAVGDNYRISARLRETASGRDLRTESVKVRGKDNVLDGVDKLAGKIREDLGESLANIAQNSKPLTQVTTSSLAALQQFSLGQEKRAASESVECRKYYENALRLDPHFTSARAALGMLHVDQAYVGSSGFDAEEGKRLLREAIKNVDDVTDTEKYGILAFYAFAVEHDGDKAIAYDRALLALHPELARVHSNIGWIYAGTGRYDEALKEYQIAIRMEPKFVLPYVNEAGVYLYFTGQVTAGLKVCQEILAIDNENAQGWNCLGWASLGKGDWATAEQAFTKAVGYLPSNTMVYYRLAHARRLQGKYKEALEAIAPIPKIDPTDTAWQYEMGALKQLMGDRAGAGRLFESFRATSEKRVKANPKSDAGWLVLASARTRLGDYEGGMEAAKKALQLNPNDHFGYATVLAQQGRKGEALDQLELAIQKGYRNFIWMKIHTDLQPLYGEPRFQQLMARVLK